MLWFYADKWCSAFTKQLFTTCVILSVFIYVGICRGYSSFLILQLKAKDSLMHLTVDEESWVATLGILPNPFGSLIAGLLIDVMGRKFSVQLQFPIFLVGWLIVSFATNIFWLYIGMLINGIVSGLTTCNSIYVAEISTVNLRGSFLSFTPLFFATGVLLCNVCLYYFTWYVSAAIFSGSCVVFMLLSFFLPESPVWLVTRNRKEEAIRSLTWLRDTTEEVKKEIEDLENHHLRQLEAKKNQEKHFFGNLRIIRTCWKQLLITILLFVFQQATAYVPFISYNASILEYLNVPMDVKSISLLSIGVIFCSTLTGPFVQYKLPRRISLMVGCSVCTICYIVAAAYEILFYSNPDKPAPWILLMTIMIMLAFSIFGVVTAPFILVSELLPNEGRGFLMGIAGAFCYFYITVMVKVFLWYMYTFGIVQLFITLTCTAFSGILFTFFMVPETRGKTLNEIQEEYFSKKKTTDNNLSTTIL